MAQLTDSQARAATTFDRHLVVTAGAGAGKTRVLIARILGLLAEGKASLEQLVALTFTNKAAAEMKQRLRQALAERAAGDTAGGATAGGTATGGAVDWERLLRDLDQARITTIHSFCGQLLREYPLAAGVDPQFGVLEESEADLWLQEALDEALLAIADEGDEGVAQLLTHYPRVTLLKDLASVYAKAREHGLDPARVTEDTRRTLAESRVLLPDLAAAVARAVLDMAAALEAKAAAEGGKGGKGRGPGRAAQQRQELLVRWQRGQQALEELLSLAGGGNFETDVDRLLAALQPVGKVVNRQSRSLIAEVDGLQAALEALQDVVWGLFLEPAALAAGRLLERTHASYQQRKNRSGSLDFSDMQLLARDLLLGRPEVAAELRERFPFLMVDEYQDTNPLQSELIALWGPQNLFVVGDPKQSIYRFRGAAVELFRQARRDIPAAGGEEVALVENFRSREALIHFVNFLFGAIMGEAFEASLPGNALLAQPSGSMAQPGGSMAGPSGSAAEPDQPAVAPVPARVELLLPRAMEGEEEGSGNDDKGRSGNDAKGSGGTQVPKSLRGDDLDLEARLVAGRIRQLVESGEALVLEDGEERPVRFGDIAILLRSTKVFSDYERALREARVPYYVVSGRGFYAKQEVRDCLNLLRALDNPEDEISLVGALRSPFFGLSDETLFWLMQASSGHTWWERLATPPPQVEPGQQELVSRANDMLTRFRLLQPRLPLGDLVERVLAETDYVLVALAGWDGEQVFANLRKLTGLARRFSQRGVNQLRDFIAIVLEFEAREVREGEALVQAGESDSVKVMSVHQSKGLEFPVVFVADLARPALPQRGMLYRPGMGLGLSALTADGERLPTWARRRLEEEEKRLEREEDVRVFYVAATRARDLLILAGTRARINTARDYSEMGTWLEWVCRALGITDTGSLEARRQQGDLGACLSYPAPPDAAPGSGWLRLWLPAEAAGLPAKQQASPAPAPSPETAPLPSADPAPSPDLLAGKASVGRQAAEGIAASWSVTDFMTYTRCARHFALERRLGVPGRRRGTQAAAAGSSGGGRLDAISRGNIVHRVLERLRRPEDAGRLLGLALQEAGFSQEAQRRTAAKEVEPLIERYLASDVFRTIADGQSQAERSFQYRLPGTRLAVTGVIDNLVTTKAGESLVIDFKTNHIGADQVEGTAAEYRIQMETYVLVANRLLQAAVRECWLYFLTPDVRYPIQVGEAALAGVEERLTTLARAMAAGQGLADYPPTVGPHCFTCPQRDFCQAGGVLAHLEEVP
ncbi:MAG: UvrD-helicase domain-containing protein [Symbiobacteriia bacterium]